MQNGVFGNNDELGENANYRELASVMFEVNHHGT